MTNKVKPFCIKITDDITPQMVQDAFDKCVDAGAINGDCIDGATSKHECQDGYEFGVYELFGVSEAGYARLYNTEAWFGSNAQEITLDQLDWWLGLDVEQEWKNGDECEYKDEDDEWSAGGRYVCYDDFASHHVFYATNMTLYHATSDQLRKPETPEQKAERERLECVKKMWVDLGFNLEMFDRETDPLGNIEKELMFSLYDAGYRKQ